MHSAVLKMHSRFFLKFLDSLEKEGLKSPSADGSFRYEWQSGVDGTDDDVEVSWHVVVHNAPHEVGHSPSMN